MGALAQRRPPGRLHCVLPGLIPSLGLNEALPGLSAWLGRAHLETLPGEPHAAWLSRQFGTGALNWGELRWAGEGEAPVAGTHTLCADFVSLAFAHEPVVRNGPCALALEAEEQAALLDALQAEFPEWGRFDARGTRGYLHTTRNLAVRLTPLFEAIGQPLSQIEAEGEDAANWRRLANEIQILLHQHPVNRARTERGLPAANALWLWGEPKSTTKLQSPAPILIGDDPLLRGLAQASGAEWRGTAEVGFPGHGPAGQSWYWQDGLREAALDGSPAEWERALSRLDSSLIGPLFQAWQAGRIRELVLLAPSEYGGLRASLGFAQRLAFWKNPLSKAALSAAFEKESNYRQP